MSGQTFDATPQFEIGQLVVGILLFFQDSTELAVIEISPLYLTLPQFFTKLNIVNGRDDN